MKAQSVEQDRRTARLDELVAVVRAKVAADQQGSIEAFLRAYFRQVDPDDLMDRQLADLYGAVLSHWNYARRRERGHARVRAFNPTIEEHGWQSTHTIIEIVNDDMPFLVDSVTMEVNRHGLTLHLIVHPIIAVLRGADGTLTGVAADDAPPGPNPAPRESFIHVEVDRVSGAAALDRLAADVARVLADVRAAYGDWKAMQDTARALVTELARKPPRLPAAELAEGRAFLDWLAENHFTFLGYRRHELVTVDGHDALRIVPGSSLGILREDAGKDVAASFAALPPEIRAYARRPELLVITKSTARSTVHRPGYLDYIAVKRFDDAGNVTGEDRFLGLFTSAAYSANPAEIPLLRRKVANVVARAGLATGSHADKALLNILATYPRDELLQTAEDDLLRTAMGILHLYDRQRLRLFVRRDPFERFLSCLIYAPRENYSTDMRQKWQTILLAAFNGSSSEFNVSLSESILARIHITVRTTPGAIPEFDVRELEARLKAAARRWSDDLKDALVEALGEAQGIGQFNRFGQAFPAGYREEFPARAAVPHIAQMSTLTQAQPLAMSLYRPLEAAPGMLRFQLLHLGRPVTLSDSLPMLEHMGLRVLDEHPHRVTPQGMPPVSVHDFGIQSALPESDFDVDALHEVFEDAFGRIFRGEVDNDDFNRLVVAARMRAEDIVVLRAYAKYMRQIGFALSQSFIEATLAAHPRIAGSLVALFRARFDPEGGVGAAARASEHERGIEASLERVANLSEDRVLRQYLALIRATTRTNFWRRDAAGARRAFLSFKFDPAKVPGLPEPKPQFEIFVYATRFEGVHLRGGPAARGGLRWSDRPEDFRTEVLGLMKAQMVKNTVIVPVGSKGGFVLKRGPSPADRDAYLKEGHCLLRGLPARAARHHGQPRRRPHRAAAAGEVPRRRGSLPGRRRRQGHRLVLRLRQRHQRRVRLLAGRRIRLRRVGGLRPQGDGHHGARRVGIGQAPLPRDGRGYADDGLHRRRHRRHVGGRVRQRHAAVAAHPAGGGVRSPAHLPGSRARSRGRPQGARAALPPAALVVGRLRREAPVRRRRHSRALGEVDRRHARGGGRARHRGGDDDARRTRQRDPQGAGRPASTTAASAPTSSRRPSRMRRSGTARTMRCASTAANCAARCSSRAATWDARSWDASSTPWPAGASARTPSTIRPASTRRITRSTSRSCWASPLPTAN